MSLVRVGLVGADAAGKGWGAVAHVPALAAVDGIELAAVCTRRPESASAASQAYGVPGFHDVAEMAARSDIDLVSVVVKVPGHRQAVLAALNAGKHVYCEWPLGLDTPEAEAMAALAREKGVITAVGLQGRHTPELNTMRALVVEGYVGDVFSVDMTWQTGGPPRGDDRSGVPGASMFAVGGGHTLDVVQHVVGAIASLSARTDVHNGADPAGIRDVVAHGSLERGGLLSYRMTVVPNHASGWRMEVRGTEGLLLATTGVMPQISPIALSGARGSDELSPFPPQERFVAVPGVEGGPSRNVAESYARLADAIGRGVRFRADFEDAVAAHQLLDVVRGVA